MMKRLGHKVNKNEIEEMIWEVDTNTNNFIFTNTNMNTNTNTNTMRFSIFNKIF